MSMNGTNTHRESDERWRLFVAVPLPVAVRELMGNIQVELRQRDWPVKWVDPELAHITVKFLGNTDPGIVPAIELKLHALAGRHPETHATTGDVGAFPSASRPKVIWLGLDGDLSPLAGLAGDVDRVMSGFGYAPEDRPFRPHITLGRLRKDGATPRDFGKVASALNNPELDVCFDRFQLIRSLLGRTGPTYTTLAQWEFSSTLDGAADPIELVEHG